MRVYRIYKTDLGFGIYKKREIEVWEWKTKISLRFLGWDDKRVLNKSHAKTFYHREDAEWALIIMRTKDGKEAD